MLSMAELGSVLAPEEDGPRGEDLVYTVEVPKGALGHPEGVWVDVPEKVEHAGERVRRVVSDEDGERVHLLLPESFPENGAVKLRGQGAPHASGSAGDLILRVRLTDEPFAVPGEGGSPLWFWAIIAALLAAMAGVGIALR